MISRYSFDSSKSGRISDMLMETARFSRAIKDTSAAENISINDFETLLLLMERGPLSNVSLAGMLCKPQPNIVVSVKSLTEKGLIRSENTQDGRCKRLIITEKGRKYVQYLLSQAQENHNHLFKYSL